MSWHFSREGEAASWEGPSLDGAPDALLKLIPIVDPSCSPVNVTECCPPSPFGTTLKPSTVDCGGDQLTLLAGVSLAKTYPPPVAVPDLPGPVADYFLKCSESLERYGLNLSSRKTRQTYALEGLSPSSKSLTAWGMSAGGVCWEHGTSARRTKETGCGSLDTFPTPTASEGGSNQGGAGGRVGKVRPSLGMMARRNIWPTPTAHMTKENGCPSEGRRNTPTLTYQAQRRQNWPTPMASDTRDRGNLSTPAIQRRLEKGKQIMLSMVVSTKSGPLNPPWVAWLMGWPIGWTDLGPLEMVKYRRWLVLHGKFSQAGF